MEGSLDDVGLRERFRGIAGGDDLPVIDLRGGLRPGLRGADTLVPGAFAGSAAERVEEEDAGIGGTVYKSDANSDARGGWLFTQFALHVTI